MCQSIYIHIVHEVKFYVSQFICVSRYIIGRISFHQNGRAYVIIIPCSFRSCHNAVGGVRVRKKRFCFVFRANIITDAQIAYTQHGTNNGNETNKHANVCIKITFVLNKRPVLHASCTSQFDMVTSLASLHVCWMENRRTRFFGNRDECNYRGSELGPIKIISK